jgi:hypothetical protein
MPGRMAKQELSLAEEALEAGHEVVSSEQGVPPTPPTEEAQELVEDGSLGELGAEAAEVASEGLEQVPGYDPSLLHKAEAEYAEHRENRRILYQIIWRMDVCI